MVQLNPNFFPGGQSPLLPAGQTPVNTTPVDTTTSALAEQSLLMRYMEKTGLSPVMPGWTNPSEAEMLAVVEGREFRRTALKEFGNASYMTVYVDDGSRVPGGAAFLSAKDIPYFKAGIVDLFYGWYQNPDQIWGTIEQWAGPTNTNADNRKGFMRDLQRYSSGEQQNLLNQWIQGGFGNPPAGLDADFAIDALDYAFREMGRGQQNKTRGFIDKFTNFVTDPMNWVKAIATAAVMSIPGGQGFAFSELGKSAGAELLKSATTQMAVDGTLDSLRPTPEEINDAIPEDATDNIPVERDEYLERVDYFQDPFTTDRPPIEDPGGTSEEVLEEIIEEPIVEEAQAETVEEGGVEEVAPQVEEVTTDPVEVEVDPEAERTAEEVAGDIAVDVATDAVVDAISGEQQAEEEVEQEAVSVDPNVETDADGNPLQDAAVTIAVDAGGTLIDKLNQQLEAEQNEGAGEVGTEVEVGEGAGEGDGKSDEEKEKEEEKKLQEEERAANQPVDSPPKKVEYEFFEVPGRSVLEFAEAPELGRLDVKPYRRKVTLPEYNRELGALQTNVLAPQLMRYPTSLSDMQALERRRKKFALGRSLLGG
tara:strand:- start:3823 stop:5598 length:1776 start_codon:yes stop_codon:yes gene_type:complete